LRVYVANLFSHRLDRDLASPRAEGEDLLEECVEGVGRHVLLNPQRSSFRKGALLCRGREFKWARLGFLLVVNGLALVDAGISTLFSELLNGVPESLDFRLLYFWLVDDIAAPELGLDHMVGVDLVAIKVGFPDGIKIVGDDIEHLADSFPLVAVGDAVRATVLYDIDGQIIEVDGVPRPGTGRIVELRKRVGEPGTLQRLVIQHFNMRKRVG
jgi:hypothetical protein